MVNELSQYDMGIAFKQKEILNFSNYGTYGNKGDS
jgi:hypothetical protein